MDIRHDASARRFSTEIDGSTGYLDYVELDDRTLDYRRTYVPDALRGRGVASALVRHALDYARERQMKIIPTCSFVAATIDRNPEYRDLVAPTKG